MAIHSPGKWEQRYECALAKGTQNNAHKKKKKNANALTTRVDFSGEKGCEMIPVTKHQAVNEIYICATSALTDDQTLVTKKKKIDASWR